MIRILVVDDDPLMASVHAAFVERIPGFTVAAVVHRGQEAVSFAEGGGADVLLLDMNLPDLHGLEVARRIRALGVQVDIIAITAVREVPVIHGAIAIGVIQYLMKPFTFASFAEKLESYRHFREDLGGSTRPSQHQVDQALARLRPNPAGSLPKGLSTDTLTKVVTFLKNAGSAVSAQEVTVTLNISRVTARRYLEYLVDTEQVTRQSRYGTPGRPENEYRWN